MNAHKDHMYWEGIGDARRCPSHPHIKTSSPCGMFDAPCGQCEYEDYEREMIREWEAMPEAEKRAITEANEAWRREQKNKYLDNEIPF
jgi:hypothetical protein